MSNRRQAKVHPVKRDESKHLEMKEVNHYENFTSRKRSWQALGRDVKNISRWKTYRSSMRERSNINIHRAVHGPGPRDSAKKQSPTSFTKKNQCVLDSDIDDLGKESFSIYDSRGYMKYPLSSSNQGAPTSKALVSSRTMIIYFAKLAKASLEGEQEIDFDFLEELLDDGADINFMDRHGQTVFHEVARIWDVDVAKFILEHGGDASLADDYGRTPLHVASAVDYPEMVEFLVNNKASIDAKTKDELQTPVHFAAKNDAVKSLRMLIKLGGSMDDRDYKERTPLQIAAELDRSETAKFLIEKGTAAGIQDSSGNCALSMMISKMPPVAKGALDQFHSTDRANRKQYYYLNFLEPDKPSKGSECHAKTPLQCVVLFKQMDLIMHPVFQRLIEMKWQQFGRRGVAMQLIVQLLYVLIWTALAVTLHIGKESNYYHPPSRYWWRIVLETIAFTMTVYFILQEFLEIRASKSAHRKWQGWRVRELEKDLQFCHPRWPEERKYLEMELREISECGISYFNDAWNYFDWITYGWVIGMVVTRGLAVGISSKIAYSLHPKVSAVGIIFIWLRLMKAFRPFATLGPFIVMIGHIIDDTLKFAVLYFGVYFPYVCAFWIIFGGSQNAQIMQHLKQPSDGWEHFNDLMYSVWQLTYVGNYPWDSLLVIDRLMAQLLCGTYIAVSAIILLNLFIALMSNTFQRVYDNAKANAAMLRASTILSLEESMSSSRRDTHRRYVHLKLAPEELYYDDDSTGPESGVLERMTLQIKDVVDEVLESVKDGAESSANGRGHEQNNKEFIRLREEMASISERHENNIIEMRREMADMKQLLNLLVQNSQQQQTLSPSPLRSQQLPPSLLSPKTLAPSANAKPSRSQSQRVARKRHRKDRHMPSDEDDRYDQVPYEGLPLHAQLLPSVSSIIGRRPMNNQSLHLEI